VVVSVPDAYGPDGRASDGPDRQGNRPFLDDDISRPNEPYWQHVDRVLAESEALGFLVLLWPSYLGCCDDGYVGLLLRNGAAKASAYGRFIGARYAARKNLVWIHGGDRDPGAASEVVAAVKAGISQADPSSLQATHWSPETDPYAPFGEQFTSLYGTYTYGPVGALVSRHYQKLPVKPVLLLETHYENDWASKPVAELRKYPYRAALAGAAGGGPTARPPSRTALERAVGHDLAVAGLYPRLHLPVLAGVAQGPGFPNLSCLGLLADRVLGAYVRPARGASAPTAGTAAGRPS